MFWTMAYALEAHYTLHFLKNMENLHKAFWKEYHPCKNWYSITHIITNKVMNLEFDKWGFPLFFPPSIYQRLNIFTIELLKRYYLLSKSSTSLFPSRSSQRASPISGDNSWKEYMTHNHFLKTVFKGSKQHPPPLKNKKKKKKQKAINIKDTWQSLLILTGL